MQQVIEKIENWWSEATTYLSKKKKEFYKHIKPSKVIDVVRWAIIVIIVLAALSAIVTFIIYGAVLLALLVAVYFLMPTDFLKEASTKITKTAMKAINKTSKTKTKKSTKSRAKKLPKPEPTNENTNE